MRFDQIRAFVRCAELGGLSAAARAERAPKSTLSRLLTELEQSLNVRLLDRSSRGVGLTEEGRRFLVHARRIIDDLDEAASAVRPSGSGPSGVVRLTAPYTFGVGFIAPMLPAFLAANPGVSVHLELTSRNVDLVEEGFDLAVRIGSPPPSLVARRLMGNPIALCATPAYLAAHPPPVRPADLASHSLLLIGSPRSVAGLTLQRAGALERVSTPPRLLCSDPAVILRATLAGAGVGQIPLILLRNEVSEGALVRLLPEWVAPEADISLIYPRGRTATQRVRALVEFILDAVKQEQR